MLWSIIFDMYGWGEFLTAKQYRRNERNCRFSWQQRVNLSILKKIGFIYKKCNEGRNCLTERRNNVAARAVLLPEMHEIRQSLCL
jgi:hypothetical protein